MVGVGVLHRLCSDPRFPSFFLCFTPQILPLPSNRHEYQNSVNFAAIFVQTKKGCKIKEHHKYVFVIFFQNLPLYIADI